MSSLNWDDYKADRIGCVMEFDPGLSEDDVKEIVFKLYKEGKITYLPKLNAYDPRFGGPVFYIP